MKVVIIGNGMAGYKFCEKLLAHPAASSFSTVVFGEEMHPAYDRVHLSE
jgi:nitrite reductase (NADH) large subunit